jgi:hypothetical protein
MEHTHNVWRVRFSASTAIAWATLSIIILARHGPAVDESIDYEFEYLAKESCQFSFVTPAVLCWSIYLESGLRKRGEFTSFHHRQKTLYLWLIHNLRDGEIHAFCLLDNRMVY